MIWQRYVIAWRMGKIDENFHAECDRVLVSLSQEAEEEISTRWDV